MYSLALTGNTGGVAELTSSSLDHLNDNVERIKVKERQAIAFLEHKPFGLPLTTAEGNRLTALKQDLEKVGPSLAMPFAETFRSLS